MRLPGLYHQIHRIAGRYHWAERDILALSLHRRSRYLAILDAESAASIFDDLGGG